MIQKILLGSIESCLLLADICAERGSLDPSVRLHLDRARRNMVNEVKRAEEKIKSKPVAFSRWEVRVVTPG